MNVLPTYVQKPSKQPALIFLIRPCHCSGGWFPASHRGCLASSPDQVMWDLWWTNWHSGRFSPTISVFPCQFSFHRLLHIHNLSSGAGTIGQIVLDVPSGLSLTSPHETKNYNLLHEFCVLGDKAVWAYTCCLRHAGFFRSLILYP
jgi:hypothetical protein